MIRFFILTFLITTHFSAYGQWNITIDTIILNPMQLNYNCNAIVSQDVLLAYTGNGDYPLCISPLKINFSLSSDAGTFNGNVASDVVSGDWKPYFSYQMNLGKNLLRATQIAPIPSSLKSLNIHLKLSTKMGSPVNGNFGSSGQFSVGSGGSSCTSSVNTDPQDDFAYTTASLNCALPVSLASFNAQKIGEDVQIAWESIIENNFANYIVEHAANAIDFNVVANQQGTGNGSRYKFLHTLPALGLNYYRLKMVDLDGSYVYSDVKLVDFSSERSKQLNVYPNPFSQVFTIENLPTPSEITVFDITGKLIHKIFVSDSHFLMDLSQQPSGIYSVTIKDKNDTKVFRVIKSE